MNTTRGLDARIGQQMGEIALLVARAEEQLKKGERAGDDAYMDACALNLQGFYTGIEHIFESIARELDGDVPESPNWHMDLLRQMSARIDGVRPPVLTVRTRDCLDQYRAFRHVVRNVYSFSLDPSRVRELVERLRVCYERVTTDLEGFIQFLRELDRA